MRGLLNIEARSQTRLSALYFVPDTKHDFLGQKSFFLSGGARESIGK
jgi:hypothetical protein